MARIRLKYVNVFNNKNRPDLTPRGYFRRPGCKAVPLPGLPFSDEFMTAYRAALAGLPVNNEKVGVGSDRTKAGTIAAVVALLYQSAQHWTTMSPDTRRTYFHPIESIRKQYGHLYVDGLEREDIEQALGKIEPLTTRKKMLKCWRLLMKIAVPSMRADDPSAGIKVKLPESEGHHAWEPSEVAQFRSRWALGTEARLVFEFALETFSRRSEVVLLGPQHVYTEWDDENDCEVRRIKIKRTHGSNDVDIIVTPELGAAIDAMPKPKHLTYLTGRGGNKPMGRSTLANKFAEWADEAGLPKNCRLHGLKKAGMNNLIIDAEATPHQVMGNTGHKSLQMVAHYTKKVNMRQVGDRAAAKLLATRAERAAKLANRAKPAATGRGSLTGT